MNSDCCDKYYNKIFLFHLKELQNIIFHNINQEFIEIKYVRTARDNYQSNGIMPHMRKWGSLTPQLALLYFFLLVKKKPSQ